MPELPDVEVYKRYVDANALHHRIEHIHVESPGLLKNTTPQSLGRALKGRTFESTYRHGKYLFIALEIDGWLVLHFGMSGRLHYCNLRKHIPDYTQCLFSFNNGHHLAYIAPRKLGLIALTDSPPAFIREHELGPDIFDMSEKEFLDQASRQRGAVKSWLMNQKTMAGIGNIYSDEILFQAGIHPKQTTGNLDTPALKRLYTSIHTVLDKAIKAQADPDKMPSSFLLPHREQDGRCPKCGTQVRKMTSGGRTAWFCPKCQEA